MGGEKGSREGHREWGRGEDVDRGKWEHRDKMFKRIMNLYKIKFEMLSLLLKKKHSYNSATCSATCHCTSPCAVSL